MEAVIQWVLAHSGMIFGILFGVSEALSVIPGVEANGVFQAIFNFLKDKAPKSS